MKKNFRATGVSVAGSLILLCSLTFIISGCRKLDELNPFLRHFDVVSLVDNNHEYSASHTDANLINAWGIAFTPNGFAWVNSQEGHVSAIYDGEGATIRPSVNIPSPSGATHGNPTGIVFNGTADFNLSKGGPARFIFVG